MVGMVSMGSAWPEPRRAAPLNPSGVTKMHHFNGVAATSLGGGTAARVFTGRSIESPCK